MVQYRYPLFSRVRIIPIDRDASNGVGHQVNRPICRVFAVIRSGINLLRFPVIQHSTNHKRANDPVAIVHLNILIAHVGTKRVR